MNLFCFQQLPRLSVDIDLNYIGSIDREKMLSEKPLIIEAIHQILLQNQLQRHRSPMSHAGGKMVWFYDSLLGQRGALEIDINFMYRQPLYPIVYCAPNIETQNDWQAPILDIHELAAGKLSALFNRTASRDLFDAHHLMMKSHLTNHRLRESLVIYLAMTQVDLTSLLPEAVEYNLLDLKNRLLPVMHQQSLARTLPQLRKWAGLLVAELQEALAKILPLDEGEIAFIEKIRREGKIVPELITNDEVLAGKILRHPAINWAIQRK